MAEPTLPWAIWNTIANSIFLFLYVLSISIAYVAGHYIFHPVVLAGLAFIAPYITFWGFPIWLVLLRIVSSSNWIN